MSLVSWLNGILRRGNNLKTMSFNIGNQAIYPDVNAGKFIDDGYSGNAGVYTIVTTLAKKFGSIERNIYKSEGQKGFKRKAYGEEVEGTELEKLLQRPNPGIGSDSFFEAIYVYKKVLGEAFIWLNRGLDDTTIGDARLKVKPLEMYILPAQYIELIPDPEDVWGILGYQLVMNGSTIRLHKEDVIHWKSFNPNFDAASREHLRGFSALKAGMKLLTGNDASYDAMVSMFQNDGAKGVIFNKNLTDLTPDQSLTLKGVINSKINNRDIKGAVATLQGEWGYLDLSKGSVDLQLLDAQDRTFSRLCNLFSVSPNLFLAGQTRDNMREARKDLITNVIKPDSKSLDDELNRVFSKSFQGIEIGCDFSEVEELQYEMADKVSILKDMFDRGIINGNEFREGVDYEVTDIPEHEQYFFNGNYMPIGEAAMPQMNSDGLNGDNAGGL